MNYLLLKHVHVTFVVASLGLFLVRLALATAGTDYRRVSLLRWTPHLVDTCLLLSALWLAFLSGQLPFVTSWVTAKVLALPMYVAFGAVALSPRFQAPQRVVGGALALLTAGYIVAVAITKHPVPW